MQEYLFANFFDPRACGRAPQMINNFDPAELETGGDDDVIQWVGNVAPGDSVFFFYWRCRGCFLVSQCKDCAGKPGCGNYPAKCVAARRAFYNFWKEGICRRDSKNLHAITGSPERAGG